MNTQAKAQTRWHVHNYMQDGKGFVDFEICDEKNNRILNGKMSVNGTTYPALLRRINIMAASPEMQDALCDLTNDGECYCADNVAAKGLCAHCVSVGILKGIWNNTHVALAKTQA